MRVAHFHVGHLSYTGYESKAQLFPHGNATKTSRNFTRTKPSVIHTLQESTGNPCKVYQDLVLENHATEDTPRNMEQVRNAQNQLMLDRDYRVMQCITYMSFLTILLL